MSENTGNQRKKKRCMIVCAGEQTVKEPADSSGAFVISVDGGMDYCRNLGLDPDIYIGDFDSLDGKSEQRILEIEKESPEKVIRLKPEKDDTDTMAACRYAVKNGFTEIVLYGGTGGRLDHSIANIQCLLYLKRQGVEGILADRDMRILVLKNETKILPADGKRTVSVFALGDRAENVTIDGLKYPVKNYCMTNDFPVGISNETIGKEASVTVENGALVIIIQKNNNQEKSVEYDQVISKTDNQGL